MARTEQAPHALHRVTVPHPLAFSLPSEWCVIPKASGSRGSPRGQGPPRFRSCIAVRRCLPLEGKAFRAHPGPGLCPTSSLVCFCITCQAFFLSARKPASAPCAARISRTARPPSRIRPQACIRPQRPHPPQNRFSTISPQTFPQFFRFSTAAFFPLGFL